MQAYKNLLQRILDNGQLIPNRTGISAITVFDESIKYENVKEQFPLYTLRKTFFKSAYIETLWILGNHMNRPEYKDLEMTNIKFLEDYGCTYWKHWADENGNLGKVYGYNLRKFGGKVDQLTNIINLLKTDPDNRRILFSLWDPVAVENNELRLPCCHYTCQFFSKPLPDGTRELSLKWYQRSLDTVCGSPYDAVIYSTLLCMIAQVTNHKVGNISASFGNTHIYENHLDIVKEILNREPLPLPKLVMNESIKNIEDFWVDDIKVENYVSHPAIKAIPAV